MARFRCVSADHLARRHPRSWSCPVAHAEFDIKYVAQAQEGFDVDAALAVLDGAGRCSLNVGCLRKIGLRDAALASPHTSAGRRLRAISIAVSKLGASLGRHASVSMTYW